MQNTIIAVYDSFEQARRAMIDLRDCGFPPGSVQLNPHADSTGLGRASSVAEQAGRAEGAGTTIVQFFRSLLGSTDDGTHSDMYAEAIRRGSSLLAVFADDDRQRDQAIAILQRHGPVDMDQRVAHWRSAGWSGDDGKGPQQLPDGGAIARERAFFPEHAAGEEPPSAPAAFPAGAEVPRHSAPRTPAQPEQGGPVRVFGGMNVDAAQPGIGPVKRNSDFGDTLAASDDADFRKHWRNVYAAQGSRYEDFDAAYRYGTAAGASSRFRNYRWEDAEPQLRNEWEAHHPERPWERVKEAVRYGTEKVKTRDRRRG